MVSQHLASHHALRINHSDYIKPPPAGEEGVGSEGETTHTPGNGNLNGTFQRLGAIYPNPYTVTNPGFRNWVPKIGNCKILGCLIFQGRPRYIQYIHSRICPYTRLNLSYLLLPTNYGMVFILKYLKGIGAYSVQTLP